MKILILTFTVFFSYQGLAKSLNDIEQQIIEKSKDLSTESVSLLEKIVNINSGTENPKGVKKVGFILKKKFDRLGMENPLGEYPQR